MGYHLDDYWADKNLSSHDVEEFVRLLVHEAGSTEYACSLIHSILCALGDGDKYRGLWEYLQDARGFCDGFEGETFFFIHKSLEKLVQLGTPPAGYLLVQKEGSVKIDE